MEFRCVHCGSQVKMLFVQYSPGNIRLMKCENCKAVADEYIECEITILLIDLILHKRKAYRHLLYNVLNRETVQMEVNIFPIGDVGPLKVYMHLFGENSINLRFKVALTVLRQATLIGSIATCGSAYAAKLVATQALEFLLSGRFRCVGILDV